MVLGAAASNPIAVGDDGLIIHVEPRAIRSTCDGASHNFDRFGRSVVRPLAAAAGVGAAADGVVVASAWVVVGVAGFGRRLSSSRLSVGARCAASLRGRGRGIFFAEARRARIK